MLLGRAHIAAKREREAENLGGRERDIVEIERDLGNEREEEKLGGNLGARLVTCDEVVKTRSRRKWNCGTSEP